jgi:hypothetical protein
MGATMSSLRAFSLIGANSRPLASRSCNQGGAANGRKAGKQFGGHHLHAEALFDGFEGEIGAGHGGGCNGPAMLRKSFSSSVA